MTHITITPDAATEARVRQIAEETGRRFEDLAECALAEEALRYFRHRNDDPGRSIAARPVGARAELHA
jgi:predicted transcriptional regulator